jgi:hypothetical protein
MIKRECKNIIGLYVKHIGTSEMAGSYIDKAIITKLHIAFPIQQHDKN